ncbi:MAG: sigma-70 family RNA polymerase sigma factor [Lysobacter sp.]|nr:sigma-70 family RNA polymerase sigma factor [Lysobacter sp.]
MADITDLLARARGGDASAVQMLMPLVYQRLRELAHRQLGGERAARTLDTTALVHELYLDLQKQAQLPGPDRARFFAYAATAMRHILVDEARRRLAEKRGSGCEHTSLNRLDGESAAFALDAEAHSVVAIDQALASLAQVSPRLVQIIEMRFFAGMSVEDTADALELDPRSVVRDWQKARLFLHEALGSG